MRPFTKFTPQQKQACLDLAQRYEAIVFGLVARGAADEISIRSADEADALNGFADTITERVLRVQTMAFAARAMPQ